MKYLYCIIIIIISACGGTEKPKLPSEAVISREKMIDLLVDIHIAESTVSIKGMPKDSSERLYDAYEREIFKKHAVTKSDFDHSMNFYLNQENAMDEIYSAVVDSLGLKESRGVLN